MFDPVSFCLVVAQQVLGTFIVDFIRDKRKSASRREVESRVERILEDRGRQLPETVDVRRLSPKVLKEIDGLAEQDPDLEIGRFHSLRPAKPPASADDTVERQNELLADRMRRLDALVTQRRRSLGLPTAGPARPGQPQALPALPAETPKQPAPQRAGPPAELEAVTMSDNDDYWLRRMRATQDKIAKDREQPDPPAEDRGP
jgi:hypothetical protein